MALEVSVHGMSRPTNGVGARVDVLGPDTIDALIIADGGQVTDLTAGFYEIIATSACRVRIGSEALTNASGGRQWPEGKDTVRWIPSGGSIACDALA